MYASSRSLIGKCMKQHGVNKPSWTIKCWNVLDGLIYEMLFISNYHWMCNRTWFMRSSPISIIITHTGMPPNDIHNTTLKVDGTSFQVFWLCKLWKEITKHQSNVITKFGYDSIARFVLVWKWQLFCHQLLPWQRYLMIFQTYFWASNAYILKTNLVTPNFFHISFFVIWKWNYMII